MAASNDQTKSESLFNPLHGGDNLRAAQKLRDNEFQGGSDDSRAELDLRKINKIVLVCCGVTLVWLVGFGLKELVHAIEAYASKQGSNLGLEQSYAESGLLEPDLFEKLFCSGAKRSSYCYQGPASKQNP